MTKHPNEILKSDVGNLAQDAQKHEDREIACMKEKQGEVFDGFFFAEGYYNETPTMPQATD